MIKKILYCISFILFTTGSYTQTNLISDPLDGEFTGKISPDGRYALIATVGGTMGVLDIKKGVVMSTFKGAFGNLAEFLPDNEHLLISDKELKLLNVFTAETIRKFIIDRKTKVKPFDNGVKTILFPNSIIDTGIVILSDMSRKKIYDPDKKNDSVWIINTLRGDTIVKFESEFVEIIDVAGYKEWIAILGATRTDTSIAIYKFDNFGAVRHNVIKSIAEQIGYLPNLTFSKTGKYLIYQSQRDRQYNIIEVNTGRLLPVLDKYAYILDFDESDQNLIVQAMQGPQYESYNKPDNLKIFQLSTQKLLFEGHISKGKIARFSSMPDVYVVLDKLNLWGNNSNSSKQEIQIKSLKDGKIKQTIPAETGMYTYIIVGKFLIYLKYNEYRQKKLVYLDMEIGQIVREISVLSQASITDIDYLSDSKKLLLTVNNKIITLDIQNNLRLEYLPFDSIRECAVNEGANKIALLQLCFPSGLRLTLRSIDQNQVLFSKLIENEFIKNIQIGPNGKFLSYTFGASTVILEASTGREIGRFPTSDLNGPTHCWWSRSGKYLYNIRWVSESLPTGIAYQHFYKTDNTSIINGSKLVLQKIDPVDGKILADFILSGGYVKIAISDFDDTVIVLNTEYADQTSRCRITILDERLAVKKSVMTDDPPYSVAECHFYPDADHFVLIFIDKNAKALRSKIYDIQSGQQCHATIPENQRVFYQTPLNLNMLIDSYNMEELRFFDLGKTEMLFSLRFKGINDYMFLTPDNYYWATRGAASMIRFSKDGKDFSFRQLDIVYNRPDKVLERLNQSDTSLIKKYQGAYLERLKKLELKDKNLAAEFSPPVIQDLTPDLPFATSDSFLNLEIAAIDTNGLLRQINIWVNDVPLYGRKGIPVEDSERAFKQLRVTIPLSAGRNIIQLSCTNLYQVESMLQEIDITCNMPAQKKNLFLFLMGISNYSDSSLNLIYAVKDVLNVDSIFRASCNYYDSIVSYRLLNDSATLDNFKYWKTILKNTNADDHVILYYSGHGQQVRDGYYLLTYDVNKKQPEERGISYQLLEWLFDSIPARQQLVLLDACESNELDVGAQDQIIKENTMPTPDLIFNLKGNFNSDFIAGYENRTDIMKELFIDLRRNTGTVVISASSAIQKAKESKELGNGIFTSGFLNGLTSLEADVNKDKNVTITELQNFLTKYVLEKSNGEQKPAFRAENTTNDWRVW
ncbi:MAG: caspase family protein [Saprospiraceae bacterium]